MMIKHVLTLMMHPIIYTSIVVVLTSVICKTFVNVTLLMIKNVLNLIMHPLIFTFIVIVLTIILSLFFDVTIYDQSYKMNQITY